MCTLICITWLLNSVLILNIAQQGFKFGLHRKIEYKLVNINFTFAKSYKTSDIAKD